MQPTDLPPFEQITCAICENGAGRDPEFSVAFQPIVDAAAPSIYAYETLVRGASGEGAASIRARVDSSSSTSTSCRTPCISRISCIRATLEAAERFGFPHERICFETDIHFPIRALVAESRTRNH
jgi:hypothetical protein